MADIELQLVSKALTEGQMEEVVSAGIQADHFADPDLREIWEWSLGFMRHHKATPTPSTVREEFPSYAPLLSREPLSWHTEKFINLVKERAAIDLLRGYADMLEDPDEIPNIELHAFDMARQLTEIVPSPRASRFSDPKRIAEYDRRLVTGDIAGMLLGIPTLDKLTMGLSPHEMLTVVAYMGVGKSILMQYMAYSFYLQGKTSLFISLEMEAEAVLRRIDVMATQVKFAAMKALELNVGEREKWEKLLERAEADRHERDIIVRDDIQNCTVDHVMAETMRYKPDAVFVDYLELMSTPRGQSGSHWEQVSYSGRGLKQNARVMKIPVITAAQLNREGGRDKVTLANVGYQSIGKHSDLMLGLSQDEDMEAKNEMDVLLLKNRDGKKDTATLVWELERFDIREKGVQERFPSRKTLDRIKRKRGEDHRRLQKLAIKRQVGGRENPWSNRAHTARSHNRKARQSKPKAATKWPVKAKA